LWTTHQGSNNANMTRHRHYRHHAMANIASTTPSLV
jgi:hypothetical protein